MIGIRILGKNSADYVLSPSYPDTYTAPSLGGNTSLSQLRVEQTDIVGVHPWSMMGAIYLGAAANLTDKLSVSGRVGPLLSGYNMDYRRTSVISTDSTSSPPSENFDTYSRRVSKWGYGGFASLAAGYQITEHFALTGELMYSGFTTGSVNTHYANVSNLDPTTPPSSRSQTGSFKPSYISDAMGMIGAQFRF